MKYLSILIAVLFVSAIMFISCSTSVSESDVKSVTTSVMKQLDGATAEGRLGL